MGLTLPKQVMTTQWKGVAGKKTVTRPFPYRSLVKSYPTHFNETACVFLLEDGRCGLQTFTQTGWQTPMVLQTIHVLAATRYEVRRCH